MTNQGISGLYYEYSNNNAVSIYGRENDDFDDEVNLNLKLRTRNNTDDDSMIFQGDISSIYGDNTTNTAMCSGNNTRRFFATTE